MDESVYLAGPEVFLPNAKEVAQKQREVCRKYGFVPLHPLDTEVDPRYAGMDAATWIFRANLHQMDACQIIVANCDSFRGACMDDGTAFELGYCFAQEKILYGYVSTLMPLLKRTVLAYPCRPDIESKQIVDREGCLIENFGGTINLMMQCGILDAEGRLIEGDLETCLKTIRADIDSGRLKLKRKRR